MAGKFCWFELMTGNAAKAETFYRDVVGWSARDAGMPNMAYTLLSVEDAPVAGLMQFPPSVPEAQRQPSWLGYVQVDDVDAAAGEARNTGAQICHAPTDIPGVGRFAVLQDPQGARIALFKPSGAGPALPPMTPGTVGWHELHTSDAEKALAFYGVLFGWKVMQAMDMGPMGHYHIFGDESMPMGMGGIFTDPAATTPYWLYYIAVGDIDAAVARVMAAGGDVHAGPREVPGGAFVIQGSDSQGAKFALVGTRSEAAK